MSVDRKEIDLIIRAALQGGKTLESVTKSIQDIENALVAQADAAKKGQGSIDDLRATLETLKRTQNELKDQAGLIGQFDRLSKQIEKTADRSNKAADAYSKYKDKLDKATEATDGQRERLAKLAAASERAESTLSRQRTEHQALAQTLQEAGIATDNLAASETRVRQAAAQLGGVMLRTQQSIESYAADVRLARESEQALAADNAFQKKLEDAARLNKAGEYINFWTKALHAADIAESQLKVNQALQKAADQAIATARGYKTLGAAAKSMVGTSSLRDTIDSIIDPSAKARTTLEGVESQVRKLGKAVSDINGPITDYKDKVNQLSAAQKAISQQANLVDSYSRQLATLRQARAEYSQARTQVLQYAAALRNSTGENDALQNSLRAAQSTLAGSQKNLAAQLTTTRELRDSMRQAGLATADLAATQGRLAGAAKDSTATMRGLVEAKRRYGEATSRVNESVDLFNSGGRTTLSLLQRIRGNVLSLAATYVGLYGAINGADKALEAFNTKQAIQNQLSLSVGTDNAKIAEEYQYIREQADRIGISFEIAAKAYAKFSASAKLAGRDTKEIRYIFETFAEVGRVANLSTDELDGVFRALEQMISKGTIQAEELRGQLGDRLFGAFQVAAQALKSQFPDINKAMKDGLITSDQLVKIATKYKEIVGGQLGAATNSLAANQARLNSALFDFKTLVAEQGFADQYAQLVDKLTTFFNSSDGTKFAKSLSDGLVGVAKALSWLVDNLELIKTYLTLFAFGYGALAFLRIGTSALDTVGKVKKLSEAFGALDKSRRVLLSGFLLFESFLVGWTIGETLSKKFLIVRQLGVGMVIFFEETWTRIEYGAKILWEGVPAIFGDGLATIGNLLTKSLRYILNAFSTTARALGKNDLASSIDTAIAALEFRTDRIKNKSKQLHDQLQKDLAGIRDIGAQMMADLERPVASATGSGASATALPGSSPGKSGPTAAEQKAAEKRLKIKEGLENELLAIEAKIEKNEKDNLDRRINAIDLQYQKLLTKIRKFGGKDGAVLEARLTADVNALKLQETKKFNDDLLKEQTGLQTKLEQLDAKAGAKSKTDLDARLSAVRSSYSDTYREIAAFESKLSSNGRDTGPAVAMRARLDAGVMQLQNLERQAYYEDSINSILAERKARLDTILVQEKTGLITATQAREQSAAVVNDTQPKIEAIVAEGLKYADAMILAAEATGGNVTALETLRAKLLEAQNSAKGLRTEFVSAAQINEMLANGAVKGFTDIANTIGQAVAGLKSWRDVITSVRNAFLGFAADFLMELGKMILKQALLNSLQAAMGSGGGAGGFISTAINAMMHHDGGVVGSGGRPRAAMASWFVNAPRYHGGGIPGLAQDEYAAILKKNEEVLTQSDPRNILNGGLTAGNSSTNLKIINQIDSGSVVSEGLSSQEGTKAIFNFIRANKTEVKAIIG